MSLSKLIVYRLCTFSLKNYCSKKMGHTSVLDSFLNLHQPQLTSSGVPEHFWSVLHEKLQNQTLDAGDSFQLLKIDYDEERENHEPIWGLQAIKDISRRDPQHIYIIDHAWTFRMDRAKNQLKEIPALRTRMCNLLDINEDRDRQVVVEEIWKNIWKICNFYSVGNAESVEDRMPVWYVMDEIGTAVNHNDVPNFRIVPFFYVNTQTTYSLLFPVLDTEEDDLVYRDFAEGITGESERQAALLPWKPHDFTQVSTKPQSPGADYYLSGHIEESLPNLSNLQCVTKSPHGPQYKVYSEYEVINKHLTDDRFSIVEEPSEADLLWYTHHFKDYAGLSETPGKFVNQFPFENVITIKDLLSLTCRRSDSPKWFPVTYNLKTEIAHFLSYFQERAKQGLDNYWIVKPYNLARSLDTHITDNVDFITRLPATGPKIAQKYITNPVLFHRPECEGAVKFDIRYVVLLTSVKPLKVYVYNNFFLRFANQPFALEDFEVYEKHFTVMNYSANVQLKRMLCSEFKQEWIKQNPDHKWTEIEGEIFEMLKEIFRCSVKEPPPCGIAESPQSRALYAADLMLEKTENGEIRPKILEINWTPDCKRACEYYPDFYNKIFPLLFLGEESHDFTLL